MHSAGLWFTLLMQLPLSCCIKPAENDINFMGFDTIEDQSNGQILSQVEQHRYRTNVGMLYGKKGFLNSSFRICVYVTQ